MKYLLSALAILMLVSNAHAQSAVAWHGVAKITEASTQCQASGWGVGSSFTYVHRPRFISGKNDLTNNGPDTYLNLYQHFTGQSYVFSGKDIKFASTVKTSAVGLSVRGGAYTFNTTASEGQTTPKIVNSTTDNVSIRITIDNFFNNTGCTVTLRGAATRR